MSDESSSCLSTKNFSAAFAKSLCALCVKKQLNRKDREEVRRKEAQRGFS
jgi:hypothetical protein